MTQHDSKVFPLYISVNFLYTIEVRIALIICQCMCNRHISLFCKCEPVKKSGGSPLNHAESLAEALYCHSSIIRS